MDIDLKIKQEKELFDDWKKKNNKIIPDGVVSFEDYAKSNCKILFVLKEVNSDETDWDLREFLRNGEEIAHGIIYVDGLRELEI